jgi:phosphate starvation-inducible protein PhoH
MSGENRRRKQDREMSRQERRQHIGAQQLAEDQKNKEFVKDWNLGWFNPKGNQQFIVQSFKENLFTIVDGPSGCGKTTTALWLALNALRSGDIRQLVFIKTPVEVGDDQIGFLSGSENDKLKSHMDTTKRIFHEFMAKNKLENDINNDKIRLTIPNYLLGTTFENCVVILEESQLFSENTMKLLTERMGKNTKYIILGDSSQRYAAKKRTDGFNDFIERTTVVHQGIKISKFPSYVGYVKLIRDDNQRSEGSKFINKLYEG